MSVIFYGLCGEGLGHCARALAIKERMPEHHFIFFTFGDAFDYLKSRGCDVNRIYGMEFVERDGRVQFFSTLWNAAKFVWIDSRKNLRLITDMAMEWKPSLFVTDWEPTIPRIAKSVSKPYVSIDSQHKFRFLDMKGFPFYLRAYSLMVSTICKMMVPRADHYVISTFQSDTIVAAPGVKPVPGFIREELENSELTDKGHLLVYCRQPEIVDKMIASIRGMVWDIGGRRGYRPATEMPVIIYGKETKAQVRKNITFKEFSYEEFAKDLASCKAVISTAGNQLIGECRFLGKPVFVVPISKQYEQYVNALYLKQKGFGDYCFLDDLEPEMIDQFLSNFVPRFNNAPVGENGVHEAVKLLRQYLPVSVEKEVELIA